MDITDSLTPYSRFLFLNSVEGYLARDEEVTAAYQAGKVSLHDACIQTAERLRAIEKHLPVPPVVTDDLAREPPAVMTPLERWGNVPEPTYDRDAERQAAQDALRPLTEQLKAIEKRYLTQAEKKLRPERVKADRSGVALDPIHESLDLTKPRG